MLRHSLAVAVFAAAAVPALAVDIPLPNGGFETDAATNSFTGAAVSNWTVQFVQDDAANTFNSAQRTGIFTSFAGLTPTDGTRFLVMNNQGAGTVQLVSAVLSLQNQFRLNGNYSFVTTDNPASITNLDKFRITVEFFTDAGGTNPVGTTFNYNATAFLNPTAIGGQTFPTAGTTVYRTPMTSFNIDINPPVGALFARYSFIVDDSGFEDGGTSTGISGVVLDGIFINPEPGTMALFGLGALGLGGLAWRRRKTAAAKKTA